MITHIDHIVLTVEDIEKSQAFFVTVLGMTPIEFANGRKAVQFGNQKINFQTLGQELRNHALAGSGDVCLISDWPMDDIVTHLKANNIQILEGPVQKSGACGEIESVYFNDLDQNLIEVSVYPNVAEAT